MSTANTSFMILSSILVLFMTPGLAFFYGGLVTKKNVVNTMLSVFIMTGMAIILWTICGYSLSFSGNIGGIVGDLSHPFMKGVNLTSLTAIKIPNGVYSLFEMMFAIITPALFVGAVVGRIRFPFLMIFLVLWSLIIYYPMVHIVWSPSGLLYKLGTLDFAGGTVVHIDSGVTALVLSYFLGKRISYGEHPDDHYNLPWVLLGATILWIGWYGFNAGSALGVNDIAAQAAITTTISTGCAMVTWMIVDIIIKGKPTLVGISNGTLCGLVGITPAAGYVTVVGSFFIGIISALGSYYFINYLKSRIKVDDALDAFGCHGISGIIGSIATGLFATKSVNSVVQNNGLLYGGGFKQLGIQLVATISTIIFVTIITTLIIKFLSLFINMRVNKESEQIGLDQAIHGENVDYTINLSKNFAKYEDHLEKHPEEFQGQLAHLENPKNPNKNPHDMQK